PGGGVRDDCGIAETFFNSVTRRIFTTVGVDPLVEFVHPDVREPGAGDIDAVARPLPVRDGSEALARAVLAGWRGWRGRVAWADHDGDVHRVADAIVARTTESLGGFPDRAELIDALFYRNK